MLTRWIHALSFAIAGLALLSLIGAGLPSFGVHPGFEPERASYAPWSGDVWQAFWQVPGLSHSLFLSLFTGLVSTALSLLLVMGLFAGWARTRPMRWIERFLAPLLAIPHAASAVGLMFLIAPSGWLMRLISPQWTGWERPPDLLIVQDPYGLALTGALIVKEMPYLFLMALSVWPSLRAHKTLQVMHSLGYGRMAGFMLAVAPELYRLIRLPVLAVLVFATSVVDMAVILGPATPAPLAVRIVEWSYDPDLSRQFLAACGALVQLALMVGVVAFWMAGEKAFGFLLHWLGCQGYRLAHDGLMRKLFLFCGGLCMGMGLGGLGLLALWSVAGPWTFPQNWPQGLQLRGWINALDLLQGPLVNTLLIGCVSAAMGLLAAMALAQHDRQEGRNRLRGLSLLVFIPLLVPQISLIYGLNRVLLLAGQDSYHLSVVIAHTLYVFPYVLLCLYGGWTGLDRRYDRTAAGLGLSPWQCLFRVQIPLLRPLLLASFAVGFAISVALYVPTQILGGGRVPTLATETVALSLSGNRRLLAVSAFLQALLPFVGFLLVYGFNHSHTMRKKNRERGSKGPDH
jgi:putative thiamine transport system permease protein